jgi:hypothetical protein
LKPVTKSKAKKINIEAPNTGSGIAVTRAFNQGKKASRTNIPAPKMPTCLEATPVSSTMAMFPE